MTFLATSYSRRPWAHQLLMLLMLSFVIWHGLASQQMKAEIVDEDPMVRRIGQQSGIAADVCSNRQRLLNRRVAMTLQDARLNDLSPTKIRNYEQTFLMAYNRLRKGVCSSQLPLTVTAVKFIDDATSPKADFSDRVLKLVFQVTFRCKWCNSNTTLFQNTVGKRRLSTDEDWDREVAAEHYFHSNSSADALDDFAAEIDASTNPVNSRDLQKKPSSRCQTCWPLTPERFTLRFNTELMKVQKKNVGYLNTFGSAANKLLPAWKWTELYLARCSNELNQFQTSFIIPFTGDSTKSVTSEGLAVLAQGVLETINSFYVLREGSCDSLFRVAVSSSAELLTSGALNRRELATTTLTIKVSVSYQCKGCSSGTTLLKNDAARRRRRLESNNRYIHEWRNLAVTVGAVECYCPVGANDFEVPTRSEFSGAFQETVELLVAQGTIDFFTSVGNVSEVVEFNCTRPQQTRETGLILRACSGSNGLSLSEQQAVADATEASLKELIVNNCDQESLAITDVRFIDTVTSGEGCTGTRYLYVVNFNCRDCEVDSKILSSSTGRRDLEAWSPKTGDNRMIQRSLGETCVCDVNAVSSGRRMTEVSYSPSQLFSLVTAKLSASSLTLYELSESSAALTCGQVIEASFLIKCFGDPALVTASGLDSFAQGVVNTVNSLYESSAICDPFFRVVISAEAELVSSTDEVALVYSDAPQRALATTWKKFSIKVNVSYQCKNCSGGSALLKNDAARRRKLKPEHPVARRSLSAIRADADPCTCPEPPAGTPEFEIPSRTEFNDAFNKTVEDLKATKPEVNNFVASVGSATEVVEYDCSAPVENRTTYMTLRACSSGGDPLNISYHESTIEDSIQESLTELLAKFCNRQSRNITAVSFLSRRTGTGECSSWAYFFSVDFTCRGCPLDMKLLSNSTSRRALADWIPDGVHESNRHLSGVNGTCFCDIGTIDSRGPSESEMADILGDKLKSRIGGTLHEVSEQGTSNPPVPAPTEAPSEVPSGMPSELCGRPDSCDDQNPCTIDTCDNVLGCQHTIDPCDDKNACTIDMCDPVAGCLSTPRTCPAGKACDITDGNCKAIDQVVPCVAVIDESDSFGDDDITAKWESFRSQFPSRPFCLLQPQNPDTGYNRLFQPAGFVAELGTKTTFAIVNRDDAIGFAASDWFTICNLAGIAGPSTNITFVGLFIDDSGSMTTSTVAQSRALFDTNIASAGLTVVTVENSEEDWVTPFITTLV